jgi:hypothetical protein
MGSRRKRASMSEPADRFVELGGSRSALDGSATDLVQMGHVASDSGKEI